MKLTILGSGTSTGVPEIGCTCPVCTSADPRDNRLRASSLLHADDATILIDCSPDFRAQILRTSIYEQIDGVLITHEHYDHTGGLDDLRPFCRFLRYLSIRMLILLLICGYGCLIALWIRSIREYRAFICRKWRPASHSLSGKRKYCLLL